MKKAFFTWILILFHFYGSTCTIIPEAFCQTLGNYSGRIVLTGVIVGIDMTGIDIEIIEVLRGKESRAVIRVWDGTDFECNGLWSMAASDIGSLNDTIIIILPEITEIENEWDVIGDYRRPHPYGETPELFVENEIVTGYIYGDALAPPEYKVYSMDYEEFRDRIVADGDCSSIILSANDSDADSIMTINNPFQSHLYIQLTSVVGEGTVNLYAMTGEVVFTKEFNSESSIELDVQLVPSGMYILVLLINGRQEVMKVVKQDGR